MKVLLFLILITSSFAGAGEWLPLWPGAAPGAPQPEAGAESIKDGRLFTNVEIPQYQLTLAENPTGHGVVILAGGGYGYVSYLNEGEELAAAYAQKGISSIVVKYRVSLKDSFGYQHPVPLLDARRALRTMRQHAKEWKIDPAKVGVIGFSAGGHLAACATTMFGQKYPAETSDLIDAQSCRPDFSILVYPVIGMGEKWVHKGSEERLVGKNPTPESLAAVKPLDFISKKTPPVYLVHSADDFVVPLRNATEFMARCAEKRVPVTARIFPTGAHGFGQAGRGAAVGWTEEMIVWILAR